jgi:hypothetical protein
MASAGAILYKNIIGAQIACRTVLGHCELLCAATAAAMLADVGGKTVPALFFSAAARASG